MGFDMKSPNYLFFGVLACLIGLHTGVARASSEDVVPGSPYTSDEAAAMGGAGLTVGDDGAAALFYNPANLAKARSTVFEPFNVQLYGGAPALGLLSQTEGYKQSSLSSLAPVLANNPGTYMSEGASYVGSFITRGFGFGLLMQTQLAAVNNGNGTITYRSVYQLIPTAGFGLRLAGGIIRLGYSLQWVNEAIGTQTVPTSQSPLGYNQGLAQGSAFSHTVGATLTLPTTYLPSLSIVGRNLFGANYGSSSILGFAQNSSGAPAEVPMSVDMGVGIQPKLGGGSYMNWVLEMRDLTNTSGMGALSRVAAGIEYSVRDYFFLRGGWGDDHPSAGFGVRTTGDEFALTYYTEEVGTASDDVADTRFQLQYTIRY